MRRMIEALLSPIAKQAGWEKATRRRNIIRSVKDSLPRLVCRLHQGGDGVLVPVACQRPWLAVPRTAQSDDSYC